MSERYRSYKVSSSGRGPLLGFMLEALESQGCRIIFRPAPDSAPFRITFETPNGERVGIIGYAFLANNKITTNRPKDEHRFQIKYGSDLSGIHDLWQDPYGLYVTLLLGINPEAGFFVAADPVLHSPTRFSVSVEFKEEHVERIRREKWIAWERERRGGSPKANQRRTARPDSALGEPLFEALVGGTKENFLKLIRFEREALGEAPGERHYLAEHFTTSSLVTAARELVAPPAAISTTRLHELAKEFALSEEKVLDLIAERRMLKMAVRGSVAEEHLIQQLASVPGVRNCHRLKDDRGPDVSLSFQGREITLECKNSSRILTAEGLEKIDLQRTRAAKSDPCSRYYKPSEFDLVAACIHAVTEKWEFKFAATHSLDHHRTCPGRLSKNVKLDSRWTRDASNALRRIVGCGSG